ncbi:hypothetical protein F5144DRAFT_205120 [Chaetomium tenue]|uniref:Uncharacterized protein n=1 Tax=Chaetomium tenue TaxID=1854479 RepID=A0ACB7PI86_9PEZI|nr:hypothetical protein F5144DRAFT_205120 [Chaetomium globosum]
MMLWQLLGCWSQRPDGPLLVPSSWVCLAQGSDRWGTHVAGDRVFLCSSPDDRIEQWTSMIINKSRRCSKPCIAQPGLINKSMLESLVLNLDATGGKANAQTVDNEGQQQWGSTKCPCSNLGASPWSKLHSRSDDASGTPSGSILRQSSRSNIGVGSGKESGPRHD